MVLLGGYLADLGEGNPIAAWRRHSSATARFSRYEAGLARASHVAMQPHGLPVNQPVRQPARHTVNQPAQPARSSSSHPASQPSTSQAKRPTGRPGWARPGPGQATAPPGQLTGQQASPAGGPNNPTASQQLATQVPSCSQLAGLLGDWPASRRSQPARPAWWGG
jgi:hypothetical protein